MRTYSFKPYLLDLLKQGPKELSQPPVGKEDKEGQGVRKVGGMRGGEKRRRKERRGRESGGGNRGEKIGERYREGWKGEGGREGG